MRLIIIIIIIERRDYGGVLSEDCEDTEQSSEKVSFSRYDNWKLWSLYAIFGVKTLEMCWVTRSSPPTPAGEPTTLPQTPQLVLGDKRGGKRKSGWGKGEEDQKWEKATGKRRTPLSLKTNRRQCYYAFDSVANITQSDEWNMFLCHRIFFSTVEPTGAFDDLRPRRASRPTSPVPAPTSNRRCGRGKDFRARGPLTTWSGWRTFRARLDRSGRR